MAYRSAGDRVEKKVDVSRTRGWIIRGAPWLHGGLLTALVLGVVIAPYAQAPLLLASSLLLGLITLPFMGIYHALDVRVRQGSRDRWLVDDKIQIRGSAESRTFVVDGREHAGEGACAVVSHYMREERDSAFKSINPKVEWRHFYGVYFVVDETAYLLFETEHRWQADEAAEALAARLELPSVRRVEHEPIRLSTQTTPVVVAGLSELFVFALAILNAHRWGPTALALGAVIAHLVIHELLFRSQRRAADVVASELLARVRVAAAEDEEEEEEEEDEEEELEEDIEEEIEEVAPRRQRR